MQKLMQKKAMNSIRSYGLKYELAKLQKDLANFRVDFDVWFSETSLYENGKIDQALAVLKANVTKSLKKAEQLGSVQRLTVTIKTVY